MKKRVVLVGAGHAHLYTLKRAAEFVGHGFEVVLVAPQPFWYSGLATSMLGGRIDPALDRIETGRMIQGQGGRWIQESVRAIRPAEKSVELTSGETISYEVLSLNVGSVGLPFPGSRERVVELKPLSNLAALRYELEALHKPLRLVVVGGGPSGCEISANLCALRQRLGRTNEVTLLCGGSEILSGASVGARRAMRDFLRSHRVQVIMQSRVESVSDRHFLLEDGRAIPFDFAVNASGLRPPPLLRASALNVDDDGALLVNDFLQSANDDAVFGGGDCIALQDRSLAKVGVYAIRQAPILAHNLLASLRRQPLRRFIPQKRFLLILNLGDGTGLATWGDWSWHGRFAFQWKEYLDRRFMAEYRGA